MLWLIPLTLPWALLAARPGVSNSRRMLAVVLAVMVPIAGPLLAMLVRRSRGGIIALEPVPEPPRFRPSAYDVNRLCDQPSVVERLLSRDPAERLEAMVHLSSVGDTHSLATLRWTIEHGPQEVLLEAALTLEEIELRHARIAAAAAAAEPAPAPVVAPALTPATMANALGDLVPTWIRERGDATPVATIGAA